MKSRKGDLEYRIPGANLWSLLQIGLPDHECFVDYNYAQPAANKEHEAIIALYKHLGY